MLGEKGLFIYPSFPTRQACSQGLVRRRFTSDDHWSTQLRWETRHVHRPRRRADFLTWTSSRLLSVVALSRGFRLCLLSCASFRVSLESVRCPHPSLPYFYMHFEFGLTKMIHSLFPRLRKSSSFLEFFICCYRRVLFVLVLLFDVVYSHLKRSCWPQYLLSLSSSSMSSLALITAIRLEQVSLSPGCRTLFCCAGMTCYGGYLIQI